MVEYRQMNMKCHLLFNFTRLLGKTKAMAQRQDPEEIRKLERYLETLEDMLNQLKEKENMPPEDNRIFHEELKFLRELCSASKKPSAEKKYLAVKQIALPKLDSSKTKRDFQSSTSGTRLKIGAAAKYTSDMREQLFLKSSDTDVRKRNAENQSGVQEIDDVLTHQHDRHIELAEQFLALTRSLKENVTVAGHVVQEDRKTLDAVNEQMDKNVTSLKKESTRCGLMKRPAEDGSSDHHQLVQVHNSSSVVPPTTGGAVSRKHKLNGALHQTAMESMEVGTAARELIAILDCGAQYGKLIDRKVRALNVESEVVSLDLSAEELKQRGYKALIVSGGPRSVYADDAPKYDPEIFNLKIPILGICYGFQLMSKHYGGHVSGSSIRQDGQREVTVDTKSPLFKGCSEKETVLLTHGDSVVKVAEGFQVVAKSGDIIAGIANEKIKMYGVQFHPEVVSDRDQVDLTVNGLKILQNFLYDITGCKGSFTVSNRELECIEDIRTTVKDKKVLVFVSGGVDSTVCAALLNKALGKEKVIAVHIDNGFMRKNESILVAQSLRQVGLHLRSNNRGYFFYNACTKLTHPTTGETLVSSALNRTTEPELKRKIIGNAFMAVKDDLLRKMKIDPNEIFFAQGTLRPDLIESASSLASSKADAIKTHHNDTDLVRDLRKKGKVLEPLKDFHKDEVRKLGMSLGLPDSIVQRHPFPGPGLAVRILCATDPFCGPDFTDTQLLLRGICNFDISKMESSANRRIVDCLSMKECEALHELTHFVPVFSTLLPIRSVGVQGDVRSYSYVAALSIDSKQHKVPWQILYNLGQVITRICTNINRVVYVFGEPMSDPILDITPTYLTQDNIRLLQDVDDKATKVLQQFHAVDSLSQMPVILIPVHFDRPAGSSVHPSVCRSVVIRTFLTNDFMTGTPAIPGQEIKEEIIMKMAADIEDTPTISRVLYDLTPKPPGTTEWE